MKVLLWCMSVGHAWDHELSQKYEDYCSVIPADEVLDVKYTKPSVTLSLHFAMVKMLFAEYVSYPAFIFPIMIHTRLFCGRWILVSTRLDKIKSIFDCRRTMGRKFR